MRSFTPHLVLSTLLLATSAALAADLGAIWYIGDSITQSNADGDARFGSNESGNNPLSSPRLDLYERLLAAGHNFSFTGHWTGNTDGLPETGNSAATNLYQYHSGIAGAAIGANPFFPQGNATANLSGWWNMGRLATTKPDIVLIMLGTNDIDLDLGNYMPKLRTFVNNLLSLPGVAADPPTIFVAQIPPNVRSLVKVNQVKAFNTSLVGMVDTMISEGKDVVLVDHYYPIANDYLNFMVAGSFPIPPDYLHINSAGNDVVAEQWFNAIEDRFNLPGPFEVWQLAQFNSSTSANAQGDADPDEDNIPNILEYYLESDPHQFSTLPALITTGATASVSIVLDPGKDYSGLGIEYSFDLANWNPVDNPASGDAGVSDVRISNRWTANFDLAANRRVFVRFTANY